LKSLIRRGLSVSCVLEWGKKRLLQGVWPQNGRKRRLVARNFIHHSRGETVSLCGPMPLNMDLEEAAGEKSLFLT
jgi:hypothetical protein